MPIKSITKCVCAFLLGLSLFGCGGGDPPSASFVKVTPPPTPSIVIYKAFDLAISASTSQLLSCQAKNIINPSYPYNYTFLSFGSGFSLTGNFTLPYGDDFTCRVQGMTGTVSSAALTSNYALSNLNIDAASAQVTWREFWAAVLAQNGSLLISQPSSASITCTTLFGQKLTILGSPARDIKNEMQSCLN